MGSRAAALISDGLVLFLTWYKTRDIQVSLLGTGTRARLTTVLMTDSSVYFVLLFIVNLVALIIGQVLNEVEAVSTWITILTAILTCRFILDLRQASGSDECDSDGLSLALKTVVFVEEGHLSSSDASH
ncbi:hypothetical protein AcV7_008012 [Taiwanofungus camphoratus]|nr:hypothetical protein AcV7_008012 [Antrodia cinnamomea]